MDAHRIVAHCFVMQAHQESSASEPPLVSIVDDDESVRESLPDLLKEFGFAARAFSSSAEFLLSDSIDQTKGFGMQVVKAFVRRLNAKLAVSSRPRRTAFEISSI